ncbi:P-loop NTPase family protein [Salinigranum halophilum]|uniref:hypothetical protein n=1 Tax=Salinigranum halophilum TaxID=2565931 RepID=UPI00115E58DF|nr:hypothetical protein [Salinigranum halophilum]
MRHRPNTPARTDEQGTTPTLPSLDPGLHLIDVDERAVGTIQSLVINHVLTQGPTGSTAIWVDSNGMATTSTLTRLVPSMRLLDRIHVARAFTPYQHRTLVSQLHEVVDTQTSLVVVPELEFHYRSPDIRFGVAHELVEANVRVLQELAHEREIPILMTRETTAPLSAALVEAADSVLECELTRFGPRFVGERGGNEKFETLVYPVEGGFQTTLSYWAEILSVRFEAMEEGTTPSTAAVPASPSFTRASSLSREVSVDGAD